ncbi:hypothetical protein QQ045_009316 [Rhodiola kirilowii]
MSACLKRCAEGLDAWNKENFGKVKNKISQLKKEIRRVKEMHRTEEVISQEAALCAELDEWLLREELLQKQRSRANWLREGDRNTRFFHLKVSHRRQVNRIDKLKDHTDTWISGDKELCNLVVSHFSSLFKSSRVGGMNRLMNLLEVVPRKVTSEMINILSSPYNEMEVQDALFQMCPTKAPGIDGYSALFFQKNWGLVKEKVTKSVLKMLNEGRLEEGKLISDNILAAHELLHYIKTRDKQKVGYFALKLDMSKAYDRVKWDDLEEMMLRLGFPDIWVKGVMAAVSSVSYVVRVNDLITKEILPERGIRQVRSKIVNILGVKQVEKVSKYLGLPIAFNHNKTEMFQYIIEKVWKKVQGWKEKMLSMAGKEILIKAVIQAVPLYAMMCFKIPDSLIKRVVSIVSNYWWKNGNKGRGIQLVHL